MPAATYRLIDGFPGYRVGDDGTVWTCKRARWGYSDDWRELRSHVTFGTGYEAVTLSRRDPAATKRFHVHTLVLTHFVGPKPDGMECCHADGCRRNNRLYNLRWDTRRANIEDARRAGNFGRKRALVASKAAELSLGVSPRGEP